MEGEKHERGSGGEGGGWEGEKRERGREWGGGGWKEGEKGERKT